MYVECIWIRSQFLDDNDLVNKLKDIADSVKIRPKKRGLNIPNFTDLYELANNEFEKNIIFIKKIKEKKKLNYFIKFLVNHHPNI